MQTTSDKQQLTSEAARLLRTPAHELSKQIKNGSLTATALCQLYIEQIKRVQPVVNGMAQDRFEAALEEAAQVDRLLREFRNNQTAGGAGSLSAGQSELLRSALVGVPVSVKESVQVAGMRNSAGLWTRRDTVADQDAAVVRNLKRHGMIPVCTSNVPELTLFWADCQNPNYGRSRNPYDPARITGASSGGEGALIGAGASLLGVGSDIGGSLRNPAHYCGLMSHKPSPYLVSAQGNFPALNESRLRLFTIGPMCRYASDLRHLLKVLISDGDDSKHTAYRPADVDELRRRVLRQLDEPHDLSEVKFFFCRFRKVSRLSSLVGQRETRVQSEIMEAQQEVLDHFASKFNCQVEAIDLDKYLDKIYLAWHCLLFCGGTVGREREFEERALAKMFGVNNLLWESLKYVFGRSTHTKEGLATLWFGQRVPNKRRRAYKVCERFEQLAADWKAELEAKLGVFGCVLMPTLPTLAHRHHYSLLRTHELRFVALWNVVQFPATHATIRLDKKLGLPYGLTIASRPGNDSLTIAVAEEIESTFGGWRPPPKSPLRVE